MHKINIMWVSRAKLIANKMQKIFEIELFESFLFVNFKLNLSYDKNFYEVSVCVKVTKSSLNEQNYNKCRFEPTIKMTFGLTQYESY